MAAKKRTKLQREKDLIKVEELRCQGLKQSEIAEILGLSQRQISYDDKTIQDRWREKCLTDKDAYIQEELAKINNIEREGWAGYKRSQQAFKSVIQKDKGSIRIRKGKKGSEQIIPNMEKTVKAEERVGDPRFLAEIQKAGERRAKLLGLNGPEKHEHTGKDGEPIKVEGNPVASMSKEELKEYVAKRFGFDIKQDP